jgi:creatinine amidohydrolase
MRSIVRIVIRVGVLAAASITAFPQSKGVLLSDLTWQEADSIVVIPIGAESKEHGPHLKLNTDFVITDYVKKQVLERANVVVAPTVNYSYYPSFVDYPGSISLSFETARDIFVEICRTLSKYGPRRFYALNGGLSTTFPLKAAAELLASEGILLTFTVKERDQPGHRSLDNKDNPMAGTHANEDETSQVLYVDPASVNMDKAVNDYHPSNTFGIARLTRDPNNPGVYSASGVYGDATRATREEGERSVKAEVDRVLKEIEDLRKLGTHD